MKFRIRTVVGLLLVIGLAAFLWAAFVAGPGRIGVTRHDLRSQRNEAGIRLVQLSDLHLRAFGERERSLAGRVKALRPDLVVLTGDMVDRADALPLLRAFVGELGPLALCAVPGNWEHWSGADFTDLRDIVEGRLGNRLLVNESFSFRKGNRTVELVGLDDFTGGNPDLELLARAGEFPDQDAKTVILQHSPGFFDLGEVRGLMGPGRFDLCLSGHTHGGQIAIGGWAPLRPRGSGRFVAGFYEVSGCPLYVSRGIGTSIISARLGSCPEIAVFDL